MGRWQPYLYNSGARQSMNDAPDDFNPKAVTMASRQAPKPKPKPDGPLVNFNRHPDSYLVLPYGKTNVKPMNPKVKVVIDCMRWLQLFLRLLNLLGAIGVLLCGIFIRGARDTEGYIMRIPPGVDIVATLYAIYHLLRAAKARTAASSASYHFFALVLDAGFIPFYVFTAILANRNYNSQAGSTGRWRTFFPTDEETDKVLQAAWLTATTVGGLHCVSLFLDLYLVLVFRKISRLPPDMNPLEDNLTSRRKTKHKHKNSSVSVIAPLSREDKRLSTQSGSTTVSGSRHSQTDPLMSEKDIPPPDVTAVSFMHTRANSEVAYSPHTPRSAQHARQSLYSQPNSACQSRADLNHRDDLHRRDADDDNQTLAQRKSFLAQQAIKRNSRPNSMVSSKQEFYTPPATVENCGSSGDISLQESRESLQSDNWFVHDRVSFDEPEPRVGLAKGGRKSMFQSKTQAQGYNAVSAYDDVSDDEFEPPMMPQPLRMNPPTPPPANTFASQTMPTTPPIEALQRSQTKTSMSSDATFTRSHSRASTPKSRYYGDLKAATQGIRNGGFSPANSPGASPTKGTYSPNNLPSSAKNYTANPSTTRKNFAANSPFSLDKKSFSSVRRTGETGYMPVKAQSPRVVSRTGIDYVGDYSFDNEFSDLGAPARRRDVSGKVAEEGRGGSLAGWGGMGGSGLTFRKVSGVA
ncbi:hypothetical protein CC78DRAFT_171846 [Lojkania enalia]|uniref:Uncharacterized protein n=1 Tax=Lojkania enalia TaxID=147567 RepID=A0A9P4JWR6_9PLEO|nr:hypothetical protein CC78DRAFT_171846 [Didymosphaeria enalia]